MTTNNSTTMDNTMTTTKTVRIGNSGNDATLKTLSNGTQVANFSLATTKRYKDENGQPQERTEWVNAIAFGSIAEKVVGPFVKKGTKMVVQGKLRDRSYEKDGVIRTVRELLVDSMELLSSPRRMATTEAAYPF